jgi:hypothetical protein
LALGITYKACNLTKATMKFKTILKIKLKEYSMSIIYSPQAKAGDEKKSHLPVLLSQRGIDVTIFF